MTQSVVDVREIKNIKTKVIGLKQTLRAMQQDAVKTVYIANDLEEHILRKIVESSREKNIPLLMVGLSQKELGRVCQIEVGAAVVAILK